MLLGIKLASLYSSLLIESKIEKVLLLTSNEFVVGRNGSHTITLKGRLGIWTKRKKIEGHCWKVRLFGFGFKNFIFFKLIFHQINNCIKNCLVAKEITALQACSYTFLNLQ